MLLLLGLLLVLLTVAGATVTYDFVTTLSVNGVAKGAPRTVSVSGGSDQAIREPMPIAADTPLAFACVIAKLKALRIEADGIISISTNDVHGGAVGQAPILLAANTPILWNSSSGLANPLTANVTALYITNASAAIVNLQIDKLEDPT